MARNLTRGNRDNREFQFFSVPSVCSCSNCLSWELLEWHAGRGANLPCAKPKDCPGCTTRSPTGPTPDTREESRSVTFERSLSLHARKLNNPMCDFLLLSEINTKVNMANRPSSLLNSPGRTSRRRKPHRWLVISAICLVLMVLFYAEENRRGRRAWEQCKRSLKSQGIALYWTNYIPAEVPEDENIFGVPEMATWFNGRTGIGWSDFTHALASPTYAGFNINSNTARVRVAEIRIALPGTTTADSSTVFLWDDPASRVKAARMINEALGPTARAPQSLIGIGLMLHKPD